jgi:hypothetical protein
MKKNILFLLLLCSLYVVAQEEEKPNVTGKFSYGVSAGVNFSNLVQGSNDGLNMVTGFHFMGFGEYRFSEKFSIQPGVAYSRQGTKTDNIYVPEFNTTTKFKMILDYVNIPILVKYYVAGGFSVEAGPQLGILTSAKATDIVVDGQSSSEDVDIKDMFKGTDLALDLGASYDFQNGLLVGGRYNVGLTDVAKDNPDKAITNSVFQLYVGFKY